jgi:hypothetical protein
METVEIYYKQDRQVFFIGTSACKQKGDHAEGRGGQAACSSKEGT